MKIFPIFNDAFPYATSSNSHRIHKSSTRCLVSKKQSLWWVFQPGKRLKTESVIEADKTDVELRNIRPPIESYHGSWRDIFYSDEWQQRSRHNSWQERSPHSPWDAYFPRDEFRKSEDSNASEEGITGEQPLAAGRPGRKSHKFRLALVAIAMVAFVSSLDATSLSVALPVGQANTPMDDFFKLEAADIHRFIR